MIAAPVSAKGNEYQIPSNPNNAGIIITKGIRNIPCLLRASNKAGLALPTA